MRKTALALALGLFGALSAHAQAPVRIPFNPDYSIRDVRLDAGVLLATGSNGYDSSVFQFTYGSLFWHRFGWKAGFLVAPDSPAIFSSLVGFPLALSFRTSTLTMEQSLSLAAHRTAYDTVWHGLHGSFGAGLGTDILANILMALVRRSELFLGFTPGFNLGGDPDRDNPSSRFALTADVGAVLSIPIYRISLNFTPTYRYAIVPFYRDGQQVRHLMSFTGGISYLF